MSDPTARDPNTPQFVYADRLTEKTVELTGKIRRAAAGDPDTAVLLTRLDRLPEGGVLVVVGETKKGKSSVVNALVGRPGVSPVAVDVATATYLTLTYGDDFALVDPAPPHPRRRVELSELSAWVSVEGLTANPLAHDADGNLVTRPAHAQLKADLLREVSLIDTPGVGGLVGAHTGQTLEAIGKAGAMLFVTDITAPITAPEAQFLAEVSKTSDLADVIIVANMADKVTSSSRAAVIADLRARLRERLPAFAGAAIVAVSALQAEKAASGDLPEPVRALLRTACGLDDLLAVIRQRVATRANVILAAQRLRIIQLTANSLAQRAAVTLKAAQTAAPTSAGGDVSLRISELANDVESARIKIGSDLGTLHRTLANRIDGASRTMTNFFDHAAAAGGRIEILEPQLEAEIHRHSIELARITASGIGAAFSDNIDKLAVDVEDTQVLETAKATAMATAAAQVDLREANPLLQTPLAADSLAFAAMGASSGMAFTTGIGTQILNLVGVHGATAATGGIAVSAILGPIGIAMGAAVVAMNIARGRRVARVADARAWVRDRVGMATRDLTDATAARIDDARTLAVLSLREFQRARTEGLRGADAAANGKPAVPVGTLQVTRNTVLQIASEAGDLLSKIGTLPALNPGTGIRGEQ